MFTLVLAAASPFVESIVCVVTLCKELYAALSKIKSCTIVFVWFNAATVCASAPGTCEVAPT